MEASPTKPSPDDLRPGRLWSLWDMQKHNGAAFFFSSTSLAMSRTALDWAIAQGHTDPAKMVVRDDLMTVRHSLKVLTQIMPPGCSLALMSVKQLIDQIDKYPLTAGDISEQLRLIEGRIKDGLKLSFLLSLSEAEAVLFEPSEPIIAADFAGKFGAATYEIEESAKCLALSRSTAAAFHALRCLEAGISALSRCLGIPDPTKAHERSWMKLLEKLDGGIKMKWPTNTDRMSGDGRIFDEAYAALAAMQNPWRNSTMHLDQKYTPDEARDIFDAVRRFMGRVANRMDENGEPKA